LGKCQIVGQETSCYSKLNKGVAGKKIEKIFMLAAHMLSLGIYRGWHSFQKGIEVEIKMNCVSGNMNLPPF